VALEQVNQELYIQWYLNGQATPRASALDSFRQRFNPAPWTRPPWIAPSSANAPPPLEQKVQRLISELMKEPDLEAAEDLLEAAVPAGKHIRPIAPAQLALRSNPHPAAPGRNIWKSVSNVVFYAALIAIVICAAIFGGKPGSRTQFFGFSYYEVLTGSMESMIPQGSLVIAKKVPSSQIKAGDVITFLRSDGENITHEVIEVVPNFNGNGALGFQTKGSENLAPDPDIVAAANVLGVVRLHIPGLGFTLRWISDNMRYVFILFILFILISIALRVLLGERRNTLSS